MILYLRNKKNKTIVDIEIYVKKEDNREFVELRSVVVIDTYSTLLLENVSIADEIIDDFSDLSKLRRWLLETYFIGEQNDPKKIDDVIKTVKGFLKQIGDKYMLSLVTD